MKMKFLIAVLAVCNGISAPAALPLTESTFTEIIKEAKVVDAADSSSVTAKKDMVFHAPDLVRTGPDSRLEMTAPDETITRVGANSVFTFETGERDIRLEKGSVLFHPPAGVGGGKIKHGGMSAAVLGTTLITSVMPDGSFKVMVLEGEGVVTLANGKTVTLQAGQTLTVPPGGNDFGPVQNFNLENAVTHLALVVGFSHPLSSMPLINAAIQHQQQQIANGTLKPADFVPLSTLSEGLETLFANGTLNTQTQILHTEDNTTIHISPVQP